MQPRYKRLINNIYPAVPQDSYDKSNLEKLTFYARAQPAQRNARDLAHHKTGYVAIGVEAMDRLLSTINAQSLNLFVESFLRTVQQLVESTDINMQLLATQSFVKFASIEENTPSYRRYDFFVSKFASMSHNNDPDMDKRRQLRMAGLSGLKGIIRKTVSDDLRAHILYEIQMDKIVPSLLFNMQSQDILPNSSSAASGSHRNIASIIAETPLTGPTFGDTSAPAMVGEDCLKELIRRATYGHIKSVIKPVLRRLDINNLWLLTDGDLEEQFSVILSKIIMLSIQTQHSCTAILILMNHLDDTIRADGNSQDEQIRIGMVKVLNSIIAIAAAESIWPSVMEIINSLLENLRTSINNHGKQEIEFQEAIMDTLREFSSNLPDYQKTDIILYRVERLM